jgi:hypothetical protein
MANVMERRIARIIREFEQQGFHRTGTVVDRLSADWLSKEVHSAGLVPSQESFSLNRVDLVANRLIVADRRIDGVPLFDGAFTDTGGVNGRLGMLDSDAEIRLAETAPNAAASGPLGDARRTSRCKAIVCTTRGARPGLCPSNADFFLRPAGPPVLQVSSEEAAWLNDQAQRPLPQHAGSRAAGGRPRGHRQVLQRVHDPGRNNRRDVGPATAMPFLRAQACEQRSMKAATRSNALGSASNNEATYLRIPSGQLRQLAHAFRIAASVSTSPPTS